jgi:cyclopropane-fatty-acyl-phospholipid synthase
MNLIGLAERGFIPDWMIRLGIRRLLKARLREERVSRVGVQEFAARLRQGPIAVATQQANAQHYEVPAGFFELVLGPRLKYSSCLYENENSTLAEAEEAMLTLTCQRAQIEDGMEVLDLGCGWGSLTLWLAEHYPRCRVTALSNSSGQRQFIEARCQARGFDNVRVLTTNIADFADPGQRFDRIVSIEMFEHLRNYELLFQRVADWLQPDGKIFVHVFCHREFAYAYEDAGESDWMARHFFTGGLMPSLDLFGQFERDLLIRRRWQVDGRNYAKTSEHWLINLDSHREQILDLFAEHYSRADAKVMLQRWRMFFMACAELFGFQGGSEWLVGHYIFAPRTCRECVPEDVAPQRLEFRI